MEIDSYIETYGLSPEAHKNDEYLLNQLVKGGSVYGLPIHEDAQSLGAYLEENQEIKFGNTVLKVLHVPGHSPGHVAFYNEIEKYSPFRRCSFAGSVGRTDLDGGNHATLIKSIMEKLMILPDETIVYSGHGPKTTIGEERVSNPFCSRIISRLYYK